MIQANFLEDNICINNQNKGFQSYLNIMIILQCYFLTILTCHLVNIFLEIFNENRNE